HRKRRLLVSAFCRRVLPWANCDVLRRAVEVCERRADGLAGPHELSEARREVNEALLVYDAQLQELARQHDQTRLLYDWRESRHLPEIAASERRVYEATARARAAEVISLLVRPDNDLSPGRVAEAVCELVYVRARAQGPASPALAQLQEEESSRQCDLV